MSVSSKLFPPTTAQSARDLPVLDLRVDDVRPRSKQPTASVAAGHEPAMRAGWTLGALTVAFWGFQLWTAGSVYPLFSILGPLLVLAGLLAVIGAWTARGRTFSALEAAVGALWLVGFGGYCLTTLVANPGYGTDALAFNQQAASTLLHGIDPYSVSLSGALSQFMVPDTYHTWLLNGHELTLLSYPALSFLVYVPALALGAGMQTAAVVNFAAWALTVIMLWRLLPRPVRWVAPLLGTFTLYVALAAGGVTDMVFLPFLLIACWRWDRYADPAERTMARWVGPIALGLAMSIKQTPWFVLPFMLVALSLEARGRERPDWWKVPARYLGVVALVFTAINLPFFVWSPATFVRGMLVPFVEPTVPAGQGLISLALFHHLGGRLIDFTLAGVLALPVALLAFAAGYRTARYALIPLASIVFFWATRSYESYMIDLLPAAVLAATTIRVAGSSATLGRWRRLVRVGLAAASFGLAAAVIVALTSTQPLKLTILGMRSTGQQASVRALTVRVTNTTDAPARPVFSVMAGQYLSRAWREVTGPRVIPAHTAVVVTLEAPDVEAMPPLDGGWILTAFQSTPATVSTSQLVQASTQMLSFISPIHVPVPVGQTVAVELQLRNRIGSPERTPGVPVALGQVVYEQQGDLAGEAEINGSAPGQSPVTTTTDARGIARFRVKATEALPAPVFFQAWIAPVRGVPHSYSKQLAIQFVGSGHP